MQQQQQSPKSYFLNKNKINDLKATNEKTEANNNKKIEQSRSGKDCKQIEMTIQLFV